LFVFDQDRDGWFRWSGDAWELSTEGPTVTHPHFTGTGTRSLRANGKSAIHALFARSFKPTSAS